MRIVHLTSHHAPLDVRIYHKEARSLAAAGHEVHVCAPERPAAPPTDVQFHAIPRTAKGVAWHRSAWRMCRELRADVYHFHDVDLIPVALALKAGGARVVYDVHEDFPRSARTVAPEQRWKRWAQPVTWATYERIAGRAFDRFVCATPQIAARFARERTILLRNYPLLREFDEPARGLDAVPYAERPPNLCYVGSISQARGLHCMLEATDRLAAGSSVKLLMAGRFTSSRQRREAEGLAGWKSVVFQGWQGRAGVRRLLSQSRVGLVLLQPVGNYPDSYPVKLFEYMAAGLPVVVSNFAQWQPIVAEADCGILVDPSDPAAVAEAARRLLQDPAEAEAMGRRGRQAVRAQFNWEQEASALIELYAELDAS